MQPANGVGQQLAAQCPYMTNMCSGCPTDLSQMTECTKLRIQLQNHSTKRHQEPVHLFNSELTFVSHLALLLGSGQLYAAEYGAETSIPTEA